MPKGLSEKSRRTMKHPEQAHNPKVAGSNPAPATNKNKELVKGWRRAALFAVREPVSPANPGTSTQNRPV